MLPYCYPDGEKATVLHPKRGIARELVLAKNTRHNKKNERFCVSRFVGEGTGSGWGRRGVRLGVE